MMLAKLLSGTTEILEDRYESCGVCSEEFHGMTHTRSFSGVDPELWECLKSTSRAVLGTQYEPEGAFQGVSTTPTPFGQVRLEFKYDRATKSLTFVIKEKPFLVFEELIWNNIQGTIQHCIRTRSG